MSKDRFFHLSGLSFKNGKWFKKLWPHLIAILVFLGVAILYCKPAFQGKVLYQEDVLQWKAMAQNSTQVKAETGRYPLWTNGMFSGMPAYQILMDGDPIHIPSILYNFFTLWLIKPASFFFLAALSFYFLTGVLRIKPLIGIIGGLAFAFSTYNPVIISVGHETKMQSIALMPALLGSMILICEKKYWQGMALMAMLASMLSSFGHMQIVYYGLIMLSCMFLAYAIRWIRAKDWNHLRRAVLVSIGAMLVGVLCNSIMLFTTFEASKETVRGGSELADNGSNYTNNGLSESAAFDFSMYKSEPLVMLVPYLYGGTTDLVLPPERSGAQHILDEMPPETAALVGDNPRYYWGGIGDLVAGPPYAGAIICLLALAGFFILDNKHKWWILSVCVLTILMSWGSYFQGFNGILLKILPGYNKFRAPSMIIVIPSFLLCMMAVMTLQQIWSAGKENASVWTGYRKGLWFTGALFALLAILCFTWSYNSPKDQDLLTRATAQGVTALETMKHFMAALRTDRQLLFRTSLLRSFGYVLAAALIVGWYIKKRRFAPIALLAIGTLVLSDLVTEDWKYLNYGNYNSPTTYQENFVATPADKRVMQDKGYYRVFDVRDSLEVALTYGAMSAYFHHSIGGYHAAKLRIYEDLINYQLFNYPRCKPVLDMLNTKYIIMRNPTDSVSARKSRSSGDDDDDQEDPSAAERNDSVIVNKDALGAAWFVKGVRFAPDARGVMHGLTTLDTRDTALLFAADQKKAPGFAGERDSTAKIELQENENDVMSYVSTSKTPQFAVFSEVYYNRGWRACIDDFSHETPIIRTNYVLRGVVVPPGRHIIRFVFRPASYYVGRQVEWMAQIILLLLLIGATMVSLHAKGLHIRIAGRHLLNFPLEHLSST